MKTDNSPPKPAMAFRVGVTGHRQARLAPDQIARIDAQIRAILGAVQDAVRQAHERYAQDYAPAAPLLYFVSALADGADTLAARCALASDWRLLAPLPFSREVYASDFSDDDRAAFEELLARADAVAELDGSRASPGHEDRAYLQAGVVTIDQSDFIIAIWDGEEARGIGDTAMIKEEALSAGKPVVWINAVADEPPAFLSLEGDAAPFSAARVVAAIDGAVAPPPAEEIEHSFSGKKTHALSAYRAYAKERAHHFNFGAFFQFWERLFSDQWPFRLKLRMASPDAVIARERGATLALKLGASAHDQSIFERLIIPRFAWADHLAVYYSNLYRSSYFFNYLFAAVAVFLALFDLVAGKYGFGSKTIWIGCEVTLIVLILTVTSMGKRGRWHEKWIDYRQLAEEMRQYRLYFLTMGRERGGELARGEGGEAAGWVEWYFAATRREAGMTSGKFNAANIAETARVILTEEIRPQIDYHFRKAKMLHRMEHRLHQLGELAFSMTLLICLFYLSLVVLKSHEFYDLLHGVGMSLDFETMHEKVYAVEKAAKNWVTMLTGVLPALGAAFFGIRVQGEFGSTAERSHATATQLATIAERFEALAAAASPPLESLRLRVEEAAGAMLMENMDWRLLYISKPLNLPG